MNMQHGTNEQMLNGMSLHMGKSSMTPSLVQVNGIDSSSSSRTASPANRLHQIPVSQLPPSRSTIPASQLPPGVSNVNQIPQSFSQLSVTSVSSPKIQHFNTSTPVLSPAKSAGDNVQQVKQSLNRNEYSPIGFSQTPSAFTHAANSHFANVAGGEDSKNRSSNIESHMSNNIQNKLEAENLPGSLPKFPPNESQNRQASDKVSPSQEQSRLRQAPKSINNYFQQETNFKDVPLTAEIAPPPQLIKQSILNSNSTPNLYQKPSAFEPAPSQSFHPATIGAASVQNIHLTRVDNVPHSTAGLSNGAYTQRNIPQNVQGQLKRPLVNMPVQGGQPPYMMSQKPLVQNQVPNSNANFNTPPYANIPPQANIPQQANISPQVNVLPQPNMLPQSNIPLQPPTTTSRANLHANRYPTAQQYGGSPKPSPQNFPQTNIYQNTQPQQQQRQMHNNQQAVYQQHYNRVNAVQDGFNKLWGNENYDLLQCPNILPPTKIEPPKISLGQEFLDAANCSPDIFRCTMTKIPETNTLLQKCRLPLGILIHPFKDLDHLPVIQCSTIVRCRACRTYINPFVFFVDMKRWKCNLCYRVNELPEEFQFDPVSKTYGDPSRRPEIKSSTIEYIAPSEYMLRPPQPAVYIFLLDVSHAAIDSGYLHIFCNILAENLTNLPGDARTQVGFIAYNSALHFYSLAEGLNQPHEMTVLDIDDVFLPCPDNLVVNLQERRELIVDLLTQLPNRFNNSFDTHSALGAALQAAHKMIAGTGGRITVFQAALPTVGPGALTVREDPNQRSGADVHHLNPANDFYKRLALECSGQQIAVDLFVLNSQYADLATISGISRFSGGCIHHFPLFKASRTLQAENLERTLKRYLTRKIGFEAVMRIRCTRGLSIHTFHGNFFVRSTDLLSLPNVNPEAGFGMQVSIDESLADLHTVCFQAALLYTSSKGERRIRVHTLCVPIAPTLPEVMAAADQQCIVGLLAKMAVDRSMQSSLPDAREAFINVAIDILSSYKMSLNLGSNPSGLLAPECLKLMPLYISALLKHVAFRTGTSTRLDDRVKAMCDMKSLPLYLLIQKIYPDLYPVHNLEDQNTTLNIDGEAIPQPPHLQLSARNLDSKGAFLMDMGEHLVLLVGPAVSQTFLNEALGVPDYNSITDQMYDLPILNNLHNQRLHNFINYLNDEKPFVATLHIIRENSPHRSVFIERLIEDRIETALSYHEFLQHLKTQVK